MQGYFYCYSRNLKRLCDKYNYKPITKSIHFKTKRTFWVYPSSETMDNILKEYRNNKTI